MFGRIWTFVTLPLSRKLLLFEAFWMLLWGWFVVRVISIRRYSDKLGLSSGGEFHDENPQDENLLRNIRWSIIAVNKLFGGKCTCLMQGIAAKKMFNRRGVSNTLVLGTKFSTDAEDAGAFKAHAWMWAGQVVVLGGEERFGYTPITSYHSD